MHTRKKEAVFMFILSCVMSGVFAIATIARPHIFFIVFLVAFVAVAGFAGHRVFACSDAWYQARERKEQLWSARHPHLTLLLVILTLGQLLWRLTDLIKRILQ